MEMVDNGDQASPGEEGELHRLKRMHYELMFKHKVPDHVFLPFVSATVFVWGMVIECVNGEQCQPSAAGRIVKNFDSLIMSLFFILIALLQHCSICYRH